MIFNFITIIGLIGYFVLFEIASYQNTDHLHLPAILYFLFILISYFACGIKKYNSLYSYWLRPSYIIIASFIIVNLQTIINVLLNLAPISFYLNSNEFNSYIGKVLFLSLFAMSSFLIGNYNTLSIRIQQYKKNPINTIYYWSLFSIIMFTLFLYNIDLNSFLTGTDYIGSGAADRVIKSSSYYEQLFEVSIIIIFAIHAKNELNKQHNIITFIKKLPPLFTIVFCIYIILRMFSGDRGPVIYSICIAAYSFFIVTKYKLKILPCLIIAIVSSLFISLLGMARIMDDNLSFSDKLSTSFTALEENENRSTSIISSTQELANSINCNFIAVRDIEINKTEFKYGIYNFYNLIGAIPGSSYILTNILGVDLRDKSSAEYLTKSFLGNDYQYGLGTTPVAETYLDFNIFGVFIIFIIFGSLYKKIDLHLFTNKHLSVIQIIFILRFASYAMYVPRFSFTGTISKCLYIIIIYLVLNKIFTYIKRTK